MFLLTKNCNYNTFEYLDLSLTYDKNVIRLIVIYRAPSTNTTDFLHDFTDLVDHLTISNGKLLVIGDFNYHVDQLSNRDAAKFLDTIEASNLTQHVQQPTHIHGHTLDLVITRPAELSVSGILCDNMQCTF